MVGKYRVVVENKRIKYILDIKRNITVIKGNSATGKTTLIDMIRDNREGGYTQVRCKVHCEVLEGRNWKYTLQCASKTIFFIDEDSHFVRTREFAKVALYSDCYFVIITRQPLFSLPYSIDEIYELTESKHYGTIKTVNSLSLRYPSNTFNVVPDIIITEDSNSGNQFYRFAFPNVRVVSANGNSNVGSCLEKEEGTNVLLIIDGAAFGSFVDDLESRVARVEYAKGCKVYIFAPESFEYVLLSSKLFYDNVKDFLLKTYDYAGSEKYVSWEEFYTKLVISKTKGTVREYNKSKLNEYYLSPICVAKILDEIPFKVL